MSGKIYKVYKITGYGLTYYGSTKKTLIRRKNQHKSDYVKYKSGNHGYVSSYDILSQGDEWDIELVEDVEEKDQLLVREKYYIQNNECVNLVIPFRTEEENKEYKKEWGAQYREANKEKIKEYRKEYSAQYREANRESINTKKREKAREHVQCDICRKEINRSSLRRHINTQHSDDKQKNRVKCPHCDMDLSRNSLRRHIKSQHE